MGRLRRSVSMQIENTRILPGALCILLAVALVAGSLSPIACAKNAKQFQRTVTTDGIKIAVGEAGLSTTASDDTCAFFVPKVGLNKLRFGFYLRGHLCFDMKDEVDYEKFVAATGFSESDFNYDTGDLSKEQEAWILKQCKDALYPSWGVFNPLTYQTETLEFQGITWAGGETASFVCLLGKSRQLSVWDSTRDSRAAKVLVFPCSSDVYAHPMHGQEEDVRVIEEIGKLVSRQCLGATVEECYTVYVRYPSTKAYLVVYKVDGNKIMALVSPSGPDYRLNSLLLKTGEIRFGGMLIEHANPNYDTALGCTQIAILPDIDGNGSNEIYVASTICFLLSIRTGEQNQPVLEEMDSYYSGP